MAKRLLWRIRSMRVQRRDEFHIGSAGFADRFYDLYFVDILHGGVVGFFGFFDRQSVTAS